VPAARAAASGDRPVSSAWVVDGAPLSTAATAVAVAMSWRGRRIGPYRGSAMPPPGTKTIATNRQARRDYEIIETIECGIALKGSEVKSLRDAHVQFADANGWIRNGELWLIGLHIAPYSHASGVFAHDPDRERKLLVHRDEIDRLRARVDQERLALIPISLYFKNGRAKVEMAVGRGRRQYDKRQLMAKRDAELEARRAMAQARRTSGGGHRDG
jgi:SsrA-binding protein